MNTKTCQICQKEVDSRGYLNHVNACERSQFVPKTQIVKSKSTLVNAVDDVKIDKSDIEIVQLRNDLISKINDLESKLDTNEDLEDLEDLEEEDGHEEEELEEEESLGVSGYALLCIVVVLGVLYAVYRWVSARSDTTEET